MDFLTFFGPPVEFSKILLELLSLLNDHLSCIRFFFFFFFEHLHVAGSLLSTGLCQWFQEESGDRRWQRENVVWG